MPPRQPRPGRPCAVRHWCVLDVQGASAGGVRIAVPLASDAAARVQPRGRADVPPGRQLVLRVQRVDVRTVRFACGESAERGHSLVSKTGSDCSASLRSSGFRGAGEIRRQRGPLWPTKEKMGHEIRNDCGHLQTNGPPFILLYLIDTCQCFLFLSRLRLRGAHLLPPRDQTHAGEAAKNLR